MAPSRTGRALRVAVLLACLSISSLAGCAVGFRAAGTPPRSAAPSPELLSEVHRLEVALREAPEDGSLLYQRAVLAVQLGHDQDALAWLRRLDGIGWDIRFRDDDFGLLRDVPEYRAISARVDARAPRVRRSTVAFTVDEPDLFPEGIAVRSRTGTFFLGSIAKRKVIAVDASGHVSTLVPEGEGGLMCALGMAVDEARGVLWVASFAGQRMRGYSPELENQAGVFSFALATGRLRTRALLDGRDGPHLFNDLAIDAQGQVYVTDSAAGAVYRLATEGGALEPWVPPGTFVYPNGLAIDPGSSRLFVAHADSIDVIDLQTKERRELGRPPRTPLGGIDGLVFAHRSLIAVQNGLGRPRLIRLHLNDSLDRVEQLSVLESDHPALRLPTTGAIQGDALYTIADAQLDVLGEGGKARPGSVLRGTQVLRTPLDGPGAP